MNDPIAFSAEVEIGRRRFHNPDSGFAVVEADAPDEPVVLVGPIGHLEARERALIVGEWVEDRRYGRQVKVLEARPLAPSDEAGVTEYLRKVRHIGARRAARLVDEFGVTDVLDAIDADPVRAFAAAGLSGRRAAEAAGSWEGLRVLRDLHLLLAPHGLAYLAARIHREYGDEAHRVLRERPYDLTAVFGVGFAIADTIARGVGIPADSPERACAAAIHCLAEAERSGSTCLPLGLLRSRAEELLGAQPPSADLLAELTEVTLVTDAPPPSAEPTPLAGETWVYRTVTERLEAELVERVLDLATSAPSRKLTPPDAPPADVLPDGLELAGEQWQGVRDAFAHRLSVVTGGPGTGKTASIRAIGAIATAQRAKVLLVAPTGRAANRMTEATGLAASTIHSALGWIPGRGATQDASDPLTCDMLIVDETSMASLEVMVTLLRAVRGHTHVVLVGDADQLAPVGAGKPFAELVESELVPAARLAHIFRQAAGSMIVQGAHAVREGRMPSFRPADGMERDLFLIEHADPVRAREEIVELVASRLPAHYGVDPFADIQVFAPVYRGAVGIDALNTALREALNPRGATALSGRLRLGDKLMLTGRNLHDVGLMNGTLLRLEEALEDEDDGYLLVRADDGETFELDLDDANRLQLAYACSIHKGQGIELPIAVVVAHPRAGGFFFRREMLYTAMTRARRATVIVGTADCVARAVAATDSARRFSRLVPRLRPKVA
jgi:exodeoxyribonuclease V alpha subunit